jgi:hypothetical protein
MPVRIRQRNIRHDWARIHQVHQFGRDGVVGKPDIVGIAIRILTVSVVCGAVNGYSLVRVLGGISANEQRSRGRAHVIEVSSALGGGG